MKRVLNLLFNPILLLLGFVCVNTLLSGQSHSNPVDIFLAFIASLLGFVPMILIFRFVEEKRLSKILRRRFYKAKYSTVYHRDKNCRCIKNREIEECDSKFIESNEPCEICCHLKWWERHFAISFFASLLFTVLWFIYDKYTFPILEKLYNSSDSALITCCCDLFSSSGVSQYFKGETIGYFVRAALANFVDFLLFSLFLDLIIWIMMWCLKLSKSNSKLHGVCLKNRITYILKTNSWIHNLAMFLIIPEIFILLSLPHRYEHFGDKAQTKEFSKTAFQLYKISFVMADYDSLYKIAECELHGIGTKQNAIQGMKHMRNAADNDSIKANLELGKNLFYGGSSTKQDREDAIDYLVYAADNGEHEAQYILYIAFKNGAVPEITKSNAESYLKLAAQSGMMEAQYEYALITPSPDEKREWLQKAANNGHEGAAIMLEGDLTNRKGPEPDPVTPPDPEKVIDRKDSKDYESEIRNLSKKIELIKPETIKLTEYDKISSTEFELNKISNQLGDLEREIEQEEIDRHIISKRKDEIDKQKKKIESKKFVLAKVRKANGLSSKLFELQSALKEIETKNIKPTDDVQTINDAESKLNEVSNKLDELRTTVKELDLVEDERDLLVNEIEEQKKLINTKLGELAKVKIANELHVSLSNLQSKFNEIETESIKPTDDIRIKSADAELKKVSGTLKELKKKIDEADISILDPGEKDTLEENCKELSSKLQSKMNTIELCKQWNRISEINTHIDKISGWNELDRLKNELEKMRESIQNISEEERKSFEEKNKKSFQKMISETNSRIDKIYRKHTIIKLLYTGIIIAIVVGIAVVAVQWKRIRRRKNNQKLTEKYPF